MDGEVLAPARQVPWRGLGVATIAAAVGALALNLALGRVLAAGMPEGGAAPPSAELVARSDLDPGAGGDGAGNDPVELGGGAGGGEGSDDAVVDASGGRPPVASAHVGESEYRAAILGRNLFDAAKIGVKDDECVGEDCPVIEEAKLEIAALLTGTLVSDVPAYSAAFIVEEGKSSAMAYGIGQALQGAELVEIRDDRVRLRRGEDEQWLILGQKSGEGKPTTTTASTEGGEPPAEGGISKNSETSFTIDRALWDSKMGDLTSLSREARPLLHRGPDGNYDGYRLSAIRRGSLADQLGIKNGDIVHSLNGMAIDSVDAAMKALDELRSSSNFKIEVTRRGQPVSLDYGVK